MHLASLFHSAEGSDLARTPLPPYKLVWPLHLCADHLMVTETQHYGERTNALSSSGRWDVHGCFIPWKMHILFFTSVGQLSHETYLSMFSQVKTKIASDLPK